MGAISLSSAREDLSEKGFALIRGVFTIEETNLIRGAALSALMNGGPEKPYHLGGRVQTKSVNGVDFPAIIFWPSLISAHLNRVRVDERMQSIVRTLVGDDVKQLNNQLYYRVPGDADAFGWHQDIMFRDSEDYPEVDTSYIQTSIMVDPVDGSNSPIHFVVGSHRYGRLDLVAPDRRDFRQFNPNSLPKELHGARIEPVLGEAGDVVVWNLMTVHGSDVNRSNRSRMMFMNGFCHLEHARQWPVYMRSGLTMPVLDAGAIPIRPAART